MDTSRWNQVDRLLQSALETPADARDAFLRHACGGDSRLEDDVRSLLAAHDRAQTFLDAPAIEQAARELADERRAAGRAEPVGDSLIGRTFSHYRIVAKLGGGGMGVVYKAEDTRLHRPVALKFVSGDLANDAEALSRFQREARTASALNHPHICTIYDIGEQDGLAFIAMEYLEGATLKDRLVAGPLGLDVVVRLGVQIADALDAAHAAHIIHRDIKPANIFVGPRDRVKVLDFGLAKHGGPGPQADLTTAAATRQGVVMGTLAYMAPEQARGEVVDQRADLWSLGLVLCEMATGTRPTPGVQLRVEASPDLERIVAKCLEPDRDLRYQHAADLRTDLERLKRGSAPALTSRQPPPAKARGRTLVALATALGLVAVLGYIFYPRPAQLTERDTIVLGDFTNTTGDPVFDDTLRQGLAVHLQQSPFLSLISEERIRRTLPLMNRPADAPLTPDVARVVCVRTGSAAVLEGSIAALGSQYVLGLRAQHCTTGDVLADEQAQAARKEEVLSTLSEIADRFRTRVGESLATIEKHSTPLQEATTPSLEALQAYSAVFKGAASGSPARSVPLLQRAIAMDPEFAMAHAFLGFRYGVLGESALARQSLLKAYQLRHRASDAERFYIETLYDRDVTGNLERERRTLETWAETYPRDARAHNLLSGLALSSTGQHELAVAETEKAIALDPDMNPAHANKAFNQVMLNRLDDALATVTLASKRGLESDTSVQTQYFVAFLTGNEDELKRIATAARESPANEEIISHIESLGLARAGRLQAARRMSAVAVQIAQKSGRRERAGLFEAAVAVWEAFSGNAAAARQSAARALALGRAGREVEYAAALALALVGDLPQSRTLTEELAREFPEDTSVQFLYLPTLRALFALNGPTPDAAGAIQVLQPASRYDLALGRIGFVARFGGLYPIYVRGLAYLAARQFAEAASEFQRIVDHRSIVLVDPMDALARLQLARAFALSGDTVRAKSAYTDLLALWKNADPDLQVVKDARAEFARLP